MLLLPLNDWHRAAEGAAPALDYSMPLYPSIPACLFREAPDLILAIKCRRVCLTLPGDSNLLLPFCRLILLLSVTDG